MAPPWDHRLPDGERGQTMAEYAVMLSVLIAVVAAAVASLATGAATLVARVVDLMETFL